MLYSTFSDGEIRIARIVSREQDNATGYTRFVVEYYDKIAKTEDISLGWEDDLLVINSEHPYQATVVRGPLKCILLKRIFNGTKNVNKQCTFDCESYVVYDQQIIIEEADTLDYELAGKLDIENLRRKREGLPIRCKYVPKPFTTHKKKIVIKRRPTKKEQLERVMKKYKVKVVTSGSMK